MVACDDDPDALRLLKEILEAVGATVTTATSGRAALEIVATDRPEVLVADVGMPLMDGFELIQQVRTSDVMGVRDIPAAALTAYARSEDRAKALKRDLKCTWPSRSILRNSLPRSRPSSRAADLTAYAINSAGDEPRTDDPAMSQLEKR